MEIRSISKELGGSNLFQLNWYEYKSSAISVSCDKDCAIIVALWVDEDRQDRWIKSLQDNGWMLRHELEIEWQKSGTLEYGKTKGVLSKSLQANFVFSFTNSEHSLPISVFVTQGRKNSFHTIHDIRS